jgi:RNA polymerase sigma-70 factor (ECF subfamily)
VPQAFMPDYIDSMKMGSQESTFAFKEIKEKVHNLPQNLKTPFLLYFEGYKYQEIADFLHEPLGTVKSRIHFARKLLQERLPGYSS